MKKNIYYILLASLVFLYAGHAGVAAMQETGEKAPEIAPSTGAPAEATGDASAENPGNPAVVDQIPKSRGQLLYENHCLSCHESMVHIRQRSKAATFEDVQYWVGRWSQELDLGWASEEIEAVAEYLNGEFYHY
jgi:cytochrome c1